MSDEDFDWEYDPSMFAMARAEHAFLLRCEGMSLTKVGRRIGVGRERTRQIVDKFSRRFRRAMEQTVKTQATTRFRIET